MWNHSNGRLTNQKSWEKGVICVHRLLFPFLQPHPEASMVMLNCVNSEKLFLALFINCAPLCLFAAICSLSAPLAHISAHNNPQMFSFHCLLSLTLSFSLWLSLSVWLGFLSDSWPLLIQVHHCITSFFFSLLIKRAFDQMVTVCGSQKCKKTVVTFLWDCKGGKTSSLQNAQAFSKAQFHLLRIFNPNQPVTDIGSQFSGLFF